jgi:hypothetical protein
MSDESLPSDTPNYPVTGRYPVTEKDHERLHGKRIRFERIPTPQGDHWISGNGTLQVFKSQQGWAEIHTDTKIASLRPLAGSHHVIPLEEKWFRKIKEVPEGLLLLGED